MIGLSVRGIRWQRKSVAVPSASNSCGSRTISTNYLITKPFERSVRIVDRPSDSNWCRKAPTPPARKWGIDRSIIREPYGSFDEDGSRRSLDTARLQATSRTIQFRLVPRQNFVEAGTIFSDALFVALLHYDLAVPLHPVQVIEDRK